MTPRLDLLHLGDLGFTVPAAAAIAAALAAGGEPRRALRWCLLFGCGMLAVGLNKIAYLAWGIGIETVTFKAASGHAAGASAVLPLLLYLAVLLLQALRQAAAPARGAAASLAAGLALGALLAVQLVLRCEHSAAEALAGCAVGALVSAAAIGAGGPARLRPGPAALCAGAVFLPAAWLMDSTHVGYWMMRAARILSSGQPLHNLAID